jgi:4-hydroxy-3-polyprenylbenzoate decarboxylase
MLMHLKAFPEGNDGVKPWKGTSMLKVLSKSTGKAKGKKK